MIPYSVHDVLCTDGLQGSWETKSGAALQLCVNMPADEVMPLVTYDRGELERLVEDIRGFRIYTVRGIRQGSVGGNHFHRVRFEFVVGIQNVTLWSFEDMHGNELKVELLPDAVIRLPSYILHTYVGLMDDSAFLTVANTRYPSDPSAEDTYSAEIFKTLRP